MAPIMFATTAALHPSSVPTTGRTYLSSAPAATTAMTATIQQPSVPPAPPSRILHTPATRPQTAPVAHSLASPAVASPSVAAAAVLAAGAARPKRGRRKKRPDLTDDERRALRAAQNRLATRRSRERTRLRAALLREQLTRSMRQNEALQQERDQLLRRMHGGGRKEGIHTGDRPGNVSNGATTTTNIHSNSNSNTNSNSNSNNSNTNTNSNSNSNSSSGGESACGAGTSSGVASAVPVARRVAKQTRHVLVAKTAAAMAPVLGARCQLPTSAGVRSPMSFGSSAATLGGTVSPQSGTESPQSGAVSPRTSSSSSTVGGRGNPMSLAMILNHDEGPGSVLQTPPRGKGVCAAGMGGGYHTSPVSVSSGGRRL